ncbi:16S rRNA (guanine(966)-N(2))-methyltransferase RsmD [Candidatus Desantisbacteria bacterium CG_4_10_14_0_8_um_filter_48_22]|uniref:16S rRNA (Guanine(966)-N(2))-methyltransferase RsmD n=1 Tax=Candidatus Desantisbacteria bacterium CG_4_10_14_0_8_um_filter_48_22 TaxID=1974543 RepID=A0A2M7S988_9BACT|nr:MAG: 16S rRNA (guanine(966)-N(2))-methyltransferase RsmD [Candidatus Desantisbacteria bacterium CG02_land_8_20_14_3_00_49_13]PIZ16087.1 MAG: 16S rRNA (guanine(966)-N(2))-methyltransferase RsmD [Candidatus Desantisbacteria bacterium CG_4_10_14_0_8_um_filter_48_22]
MSQGDSFGKGIYLICVIYLKICVISENMMRITGGEFRGRKIKTLEGISTRPISEMARKALFDLIGPRVIDSAFLDLFAGTGSVGIEALSRNAVSAVFVENAEKAVRVIEYNLKTLGIGGRSSVFRNDVLSWLNIAEAKGDEFDIIFIGPPYYKGYADRVLDSLEKKNVLREGGVIFVQRHKKEKVIIPGGLALADERKYGDTVLLIIKVKPVKPVQPFKSL